jgi:uncharacterized membrane protein
MTSTLKQVSSELVPPIVQAIELVGVAIITVGAALTLLQFLLRLARREDSAQAITCFRSSLGRAILAGLEFLVAADIINTVVVELTLQSVASLALIVVIRTLLSFSLEAEIEGRWPWQRHDGQEKKRA